MPIYGVSITKQTSWRGQLEKFSNVYHYNFLNLDAQTSATLIDTLVAAERAIHSTAVTFVEGRTWGPVGNPAESDTILIKDVAPGTAGQSADTPQMDREACFLIFFDTSRQDSRSRKITLKKWIHACSALGGSDAMLGGTASVGATQRSLLGTYANKALDPVPGTLTGKLCAPSGALSTGTVKVKDWIEHHEFSY